MSVPTPEHESTGHARADVAVASHPRDTAVCPSCHKAELQHVRVTECPSCGFRHVETEDNSQS